MYIYIYLYIDFVVDRFSFVDFTFCSPSRPRATAELCVVLLCSLEQSSCCWTTETSTEAAAATSNESRRVTSQRSVWLRR